MLSFLKIRVLEADKHESKPPCLIVLDLEVVFCGKELFLSKKSILPLPCL